MALKGTIAAYAAVFAVAFAVEASQPPSPSEPEVSGPKQSENKESQGPSANHERGTKDSPFFVELHDSEGSDPETYRKHQESQQKSSVEWRLTTYTGLAALFTFLLVVTGATQIGLFYWQLRLMSKGIEDGTKSAEAAALSAQASDASARTARTAMIEANRARLVVDNIQVDMRPDPADRLRVRYRFLFQWINGGNTPTKNMVTHVHFHTSDIPLSNDFDFTYETKETAKAMVGPKMHLRSPHVPTPGISAEDMMANFQGKKFMYVWGWVRYSDIFDGTPSHITRFCFQIVANGNPLEPGPEGRGVDFHYPFATAHNCADDECTYQ